MELLKKAIEAVRNIKEHWQNYPVWTAEQQLEADAKVNVLNDVLYELERIKEDYKKELFG